MVSLYMGFFKQVQVFICCINKPWKDLPELRQDWFENKTQPRMTTCMVPSLETSSRLPRFLQFNSLMTLAFI